ncbi:RNA demethylase ALKBH10B-like [Salvia divinorum]|uniref:RNA demethylase ALKBH10B-like n=1 Tax=Salvia divinorum TaxID=28513 RepID=A0ABD1HKJ5_SALDI
MAMQSGAMAVPDKIPVQWYNHPQQPPHHQVDEREVFLMWLRGEFTAANAIIDALCHHLRAVGEPGEYEGVIGSVQQRRCNWNPILHMQHHFSVADVVYALHQVGWRRQQKVVGFEGGARTGGAGGKEFRRGGFEVQNFGAEMNGKDLNNGSFKSNLKVAEKLDEGDNNGKVEEKEEKEVMGLDEKSEVNGTETTERSTQEIVAHADVEAENNGSCSVDGSGLLEKSTLEVSPKSFVATEIFDGKSVNIVEGLTLYEDLFDGSEILKLNNLVNDLRTAGERGQLQGQTSVALKRPMKGHGREMIQLGVPIADATLEDEGASGTSRDPKIEPIPVELQDVVERLLTKNIVSTKPDSAIIDIFNEGDHSQPHIWPQWLGRPVCVISLTECEMSFGKVMAVDSPGIYRGVLKLSLSPGTTITMQGRSADIARHAIPSLQKQRILVTLVKLQSKKTIGSDAHRFLPPSATWAPPPSRSPSHIQQYGPVPSTGMLPPPNGIQVQPMFVSTPVAPGIAYPTPVALPPTSAGWSATPPRHPQPRLPVPGTGVFLPSQGSGNSSNQPAATENNSLEMSARAEEHSAGKSNGLRSSPEVDDESTRQECNGSSDELNRGAAILKEEEQENSGAAV